MGGTEFLIAAMAASTVLQGTSQAAAARDDRRLQKWYDQQRQAEAQAKAVSITHQQNLMIDQQRVENETRRRRLARTIAQQRAAFGASGIDPDAGSALAVQMGSVKEEAQQAADATRLTQRQLDALTAEKQWILDWSEVSGPKGVSPGLAFGLGATRGAVSNAITYSHLQPAKTKKPSPSGRPT